MAILVGRRAVAALFLIMAAFAGGLASGCGERRAEATVFPAPGELAVRRGDLERVVLLTGELRAVRAARIVVPRTPNWQMPVRWMADDGALVRAGQKILELDNTQFSGDLEQKRLDQARALNELRRKEADIAVDLADKEFAVERTTIALAKARLAAEIPEDVRSRRDHQEAQLALARAEIEMEKALEDLDAGRKAATAELEELRITLESARREIREAEQAIAALTLTAPRDGILVVSEHPREGRKIQVGDNVWVGLEVMAIPDLSEMQVVAHLSDVDDGQISVGMPARCTLDTYPDRSYSGRVAEMTTIAKEQGRDSLRRAFRVTLPLDGADPERMLPGMSVKVEVLPPSVQQVLLAPRGGLDLSGGSPQAGRVGPCNALECVIEEDTSESARLRVKP